MLPDCYFEILCCPRCRGDLAQVDEQRLHCGGCAAEYPIVEGVPVLLAGTDDEVSRAVSSFYSGVWDKYREKRAAGVAHDDVSRFGKRYVRRTEDRFIAPFRKRRGRKRFFLDAACGAFPRKRFGLGYTYHVCLDFTVEAAIAARREIGSRALPVCGSLLRLPLKDGVCDGVLASHCVYHIDADLQGTALRELLRALAPGGQLVVFYANPDNVQSKLIEEPRLGLLRALLERGRRKAPPAPVLITDQGPTVYCYLHPIETVERHLASVHPDARISVRPLCLLPYDQRAPLFQEKGFYSLLAYVLCMSLEKLYERRPDLSYYLTFLVERGA